MAHRLLWMLPASASCKTVFALGAVIALWGGGACLYSDPINTPPTVTIRPAGPVPRKQKVTFSAETSDDVVSLEWKQIKCVIPSGGTATQCSPCPASANDNPPTWDLTLADGFTVEDTDLPSCIWAIVTDHFQAKAAAIFALKPENTLPVANIRVATGMYATGTDQLRLYREIELSADKSMDADNDPLGKPQWRLLDPLPLGSAIDKDDPNLGMCANHLPTSWCFTPDVAGDYNVQVTVNDGYGDVVVGSSASPSTITSTIKVARDQFPCLILGNESPVTLYSKETPLSVSWDDDGAKVHFKWFTGTSVDALQLVDNDFPQYTPDPRAIGDVLIVRVEIYDEKNELEIKRYEASCDNAHDTCGQPIGQIVCNQRWTWRVRYQ